MLKKVFDLTTPGFVKAVFPALLAVLMLAGTTGSAFATVKSYVFPSMHERKIALEDTLMTPPMISTVEDALQVEATPVEAGSSLTQGILYQAAVEYDAALAHGEKAAMTHMLDYLERSGVNTELADILIEEISHGRYEAQEPVVNALKTLASSAR